MGWFKRNNKAAGDSSLVRVAERIAGQILDWQSSLSAKLNMLAKRMDQRMLLALFVIAGLAFGSYCLRLVSSLFR